jgi:hypothetical protein
MRCAVVNWGVAAAIWHDGPLAKKSGVDSKKKEGRA